jgi:UDP-N-acetylmuramoyl-tripeptide--D-alanyl-D-alanine ligase
MMTLEELVTGTEGKVVSRLQHSFGGIGTDSREDLTGKIFVALEGDNFDAHDFLSQAVKAGATALLVHRLPGTEEVERLVTEELVTIVKVDDTLCALQRLATFWRRKQNAKVLALTGSNGKTTTKEFAATLIGSYKNVHYSKGSLNNHWGVPLTLLAIRPEHDIAIVEMGMNHPGELTDLVKIAEPDVVMVTMVGRGHLEGLGSIDGVARAKAEIYEAASPQAMMIFNLENPYTRDLFEQFGRHRPSGKVLKFAGVEYASNASWPGVDVSLGIREMTPENMRVAGQIGGISGETVVPVFGKQNITNIMAAVSLAIAAGVSAKNIWSALSMVRTSWGRNQWVTLKSGARVLFDGYNANPESMGAAIENFAHLKLGPGRKFAVLAEMREMGEHAPQVHREIGERAAQAGFSGISFFGPSKLEFVAGLEALGFSKLLLISDTYEESLAPRMLPVLQEGDIVLMKGSRAMALEKALMSLEPVDFKKY